MLQTIQTPKDMEGKIKEGKTEKGTWSLLYQEQKAEDKAKGDVPTVKLSRFTIRETMCLHDNRFCAFLKEHKCESPGRGAIPLWELRDYQEKVINLHIKYLELYPEDKVPSRAETTIETVLDMDLTLPECWFTKDTLWLHLEKMLKEEASASNRVGQRTCWKLDDDALKALRDHEQPVASDFDFESQDEFEASL
jgi:hypothetical protein